MPVVRMIWLAAAALVASATAASAAACLAPHSIRSVSNGKRLLSEYVRFEIIGSPNRPYVVRDAHPPFVAEPGGAPVSVHGGAFKRITFRNVHWTCAIRENLSLPRLAIRDVKKLAQHEGVVDYVVGYFPRLPYRGTRAYRRGANWRVEMRFRR